jgi:hypothetical protein
MTLVIALNWFESSGIVLVFHPLTHCIRSRIEKSYSEGEFCNNRGTLTQGVAKSRERSKVVELSKQTPIL